ncbi:MAG: DUF4388 domain-containing protein [Deltaproteobacteria bacterium]|nr:MAG: DUF4388 domain-containing protein [Deltaproteobacteria bacterium]
MRQETILLLDWAASESNDYLPTLEELGQIIESEDVTNTPPTLVIAHMPVSKDAQSLLDSLQGQPNRPFSLFLLDPSKAAQATQAIQLGADDILRLPLSSRELGARLQLLADRRRREQLGRPEMAASGQLSDISIRELVELFGRGQGTASVKLALPSHRGALYFNDGQLIGATLNHRNGMDALVRLLSMNEGTFTSEPQLPDEEEDSHSLIQEADPLTAALKVESVWSECLGRLPALEAPVQVEFQRVQNNLDKLTNLAEQLLWQLAAHRTVGVLIESFDGNLTEALHELASLYQQNYFHTSEVKEEKAVGFDAKSPSLEGLPTQSQERIGIPTNDFKDGLASAAEEAAAQLLAAAQSSGQVVDPINRDKYPSFLELPIPPSESQAGLDASEAAATITKIATPETAPAARSTLDDMFGPDALNLDLPEPTPLPLPTAEDDDAFEMTDFKNISDEESDDEQPLPTEQNYEDDWSATPHLQLLEERPMTTLSDMTAPPQTPSSLLEDPDPALHELDPHYVEQPAISAELESVPSSSSGSLPSGVFTSYSHEDTSEVNSESIVGVESLPSSETTAFASKVNPANHTLPITAVPTAVVAELEEDAVVDDSDGEDLQNLLRAETLDILGKIVQTELAAGPSQPATEEVIAAGHTLAIGQGVSHDQLHATPSYPELEPIKPVASYTLEFDSPTSSQPLMDAASEPVSLDPRGKNPKLSQTDAFGSFESTVETNHSEPPKRRRRPPSLEMPVPKDTGDIQIGNPSMRVSDELRLSDEFFLHEDELHPNRRGGRFKSFLTWSLIGILFAGVGFLGMAGFARYKQGKNIWPFSGAPTPTRQAKTRKAPKRVAPRVERRVPAPTPPRLDNTAPADGGADTNPQTQPERRDPPEVQTPERKDPPETRAPERKDPPEARPEVRRPVVRRPVRVARRRVVRRRVVRRRRPPRRRAQRVARGGSQARVKRLYQQAMGYKRRERFRNAEVLLRRALRMRPKNPAPIYSALGQVLYERERTRAAVSYLQRAYRISPRQTGAGLVTLGSIYYEQGKRGRARTIYRQYLKYFPRGRHANDVKAMLRN